MDWSRAKSILIVAFFLLDLSLGFQLWVVGLPDPALASSRTPQAPEEVRRNLAAAGIALTEPLPRQYPLAMRRVRVQVERRPVEEVADIFFPGGAGVVDSPWSDIRGKGFRRAGEDLTVLPQGLILYQRRGPTAGGLSAATDPEGARKAADRFVSRTFGMDRTVAFDYALPSPSQGAPAFRVHYVERYGNLPLFGGAMGAEVAGDVRSFHRFWLTPQGEVGPRQQVIPPAQALLALATELRRCGAGGRLLVERVELGYHSKVEEWAKAWEEQPAWRILAMGGQPIYINAFTGILEEPLCGSEKKQRLETR